ncbi:MAG: hypothetical protein M0042_14175 [Nitrospiraceae bacterium]|nr:hypothetical protein [Nitrospiraceae bacterium]
MRKNLLIFPAVFALLFLYLSEANAAMTVTPNIHRSGDEGYFSAVIPRPKNAPEGWLSIVAKRKEGDIYLVHASLPAQTENEQTPSITLAGRYGKAGTASVVILAKPALDAAAEYQPLMTVTFTLPDAPKSDPEVMETWAKLQQRIIYGMNYGGGDTFSVYWNMVAGRRYGLEASSGWDGERWRGNRETPDLYDIFTGAAAIQESLQLEVLGARGRQSQSGGPTKAGLVSLATLSGPAVKSHPFEEMLKGRSPKVPVLSGLIPADQYAVFFTDINKQLELADLLEEWGGSLLESLHASSRDFRVRKKLVTQLCLETSVLTRLFGDRVIGSMAMTGGDPFLKEGTDFTVLFALKNREVFLAQMERRYADAVSAHKARRDEFSSGGLKHIAVTTFDRSISSYLVVIGDVAVVSNNLEALRRVIETSAGKLPSLKASRDFQYLRTIFPEGDDKNEDIFIYLSDAHIRRLVGPASKIGEAHRITCAANLQILANARFWYRSERRREPTMQDLKSGGYLGDSALDCPDGGSYDLERGTGTPVCSVHNRQGYLTPLAAVAVRGATNREATQYKAFVENYNRYWRQFFDPIGIRVKLGENIRIQTCILPLIENSWYDGFAAFSGRETGTVTEATVLPRTIVSLRGHVSRDWLEKVDFFKSYLQRRKLSSRWLGNEFSLNLCDGPVLFTLDGRVAGMLGQEMNRPSLSTIVVGYILSAVNLPTYLSVKVNDPGEAERTLPLIFQGLMAEHRSREFSAESYALEPYKDKQITVFSFSLFVAKLRLYAAVIGDRLVIASRQDIITDLIDASSTKGASNPGNLEFSVYRTAFRDIEPTVSLGYQEDIRHACHKNLALAQAILDIGGAKPDEFASVAFALRGYEPYCPSGGTYRLDPVVNRVECSLHGKAYRPKQPLKGRDDAQILRLVNSIRKINARLAFTPEGLMTTVELQRTSVPRQQDKPAKKGWLW